MQREKMKYLKPVIHSIAVGQILPIAASPGGSVVIPPGGPDGGRPMQSKPYDPWEYCFDTDDDETAYEDDW